MENRRFLAKVAVHLLLFREGKVLLLRRYNTGWQDGNWSVVAGHLEGGEEVRAAMAREALEEADVTIAPEDLTVVHVMHRRSDDERIDFFLTADRWQGEVRNAEPDKCDRLEWFDPDQLPENVIPYIHRAIAAYREGRYYDGFGWDIIH